MSRAARRRMQRFHRKQAVEDRKGVEGLRAEVDRILAGDAVPRAMTTDQVLELIRDGAEKMARHMVAAGAVVQAPWGQSFDPRVLEKTLDTARLMLDQGNRGVDQRGDAVDLSDGEAAQYLFQVVGAAVSLGAAAVLYLKSSPVPYDLARWLRSTETA